MAFSVQLEISTSPKNKVDKSLSTITTLTGTLKDGTSIIDPKILIECDLSSIVNCNYMTISTFGRSYFVTDIKSIKNGIVEITGHVDVISTYASAIRSNSAILRRQENKWNLYLNDGSFKVYQNASVLTKSFPNGFTTQEFVLAVAGS